MSVFFFLPAQATEYELLWCMRITMIIVGIAATVLGLTIKSVYALWFLCSDFVFVILFPQLFCVIYFSRCNTYGSLCGYIVGLFFRIAGGDATLGLPVLIRYPFFHETEGQLFPFRTFSMATSFITILVVSYSLDYLFKAGTLKRKWDIFQAVVNIPPASVDKYESVQAENVQLNQLGPEMEALGSGLPNDPIQREKLLDVGKGITSGMPLSVSKEPLKEEIIEDSPTSSSEDPPPVMMSLQRPRTPHQPNECDQRHTDKSRPTDGNGLQHQLLPICPCKTSIKVIGCWWCASSNVACSSQELEGLAMTVLNLIRSFLHVP